MTRRRIYTLALWLPLLYPLIVSLGEAFLHEFTWHQMSQLSGVIILTGLCSGIQYLLFAAAISYWFAEKEMEEINRSIWFLPGLFTIICSVGLWFFFTYVSMHAVRPQARDFDAVPIYSVMGASNIVLFILASGYGYLIFVQLLIHFFEKVGLLQE